jgi:5-(carboxyamino)imidazole ribonucleotide mutase
MIATGDSEMMKKLKAYKENLKQKIVKANEDLSKVEYKFKTN